MKMITADLVVDETKRDTKGRRITPKERREELLNEYEQSGLTQAAFARRAGVN
jgi:transposase-like protein